MKLTYLYFKIIPIIILSLSITNLHAAGLGKKLSVFVSIMPEVYFVQQVGGNRVNVQALVQPGQSPATYAITPKQMTGLARSDIFFKIGVPFENGLLPKIKRSLPHLLIINLQKNTHLLKLDNHDHNYPKNEGSNINNLDPHTWLDPQLVIQHARIIKNSLIRLDPKHKQQYSANFSKFSTELQQLDQTLRKKLRPYSGQNIYVFHPAYGYFCKAYNLIQKAVAVKGKEPGAKYLGKLLTSARNDKIKAIFIQSQFSSKTAKAIAQAIDAQIIRLDPLAMNYMENMRHMADEIIKYSQLSPKQTKPNLL